MDQLSGQRVVYYHSIQPGKWVVVQSFAGHLWIAINSVTKERLLIKNKSIWVCEPWNKNGTTAQDKRPVLLCVTVPVYTLRELCIKYVRKKTNADVKDLHIPRELIEEIKEPFFKYIMPFQR
ncbi:Vhl [Bugula neritina]|uniref:Vhl n=1 Tax=Bugula neritina TaxID=10212 RepID=A0A7J7KKR2_BUGNE|nr:Vhl [Bugula neritina]